MCSCAYYIIVLHDVFPLDFLLYVKFHYVFQLSIDLDVLDPAFAPGVSHHEPGGMSVRDVLHIIQNFGGQLIGGDLVELNPERDLNGVTAMVAAKILREMSGCNKHTVQE
mgnify:CR=1 FL=1